MQILIFTSQSSLTERVLKLLSCFTDLGSDLLDELEQAKHFPTRDAACQSMRQQLEKLSVLTKQHTTLLGECEKKLSDCIELRRLEQQANQVSGDV